MKILKSRSRYIMNDERLDGLAMTYKHLCLTEHFKHLCVYILIRLSLNRRNSRKDFGQNSSPYLLGKSKWMSVLCHGLIFGILIGQIIGCMHWYKLSHSGYLDPQRNPRVRDKHLWNKATIGIRLVIFCVDYNIMRRSLTFD